LLRPLRTGLRPLRPPFGGHCGKTFDRGWAPLAVKPTLRRNLPMLGAARLRVGPFRLRSAGLDRFTRLSLRELSQLRKQLAPTNRVSRSRTTFTERSPHRRGRRSPAVAPMWHRRLPRQAASDRGSRVERSPQRWVQAHRRFPPHGKEMPPTGKSPT